MKLRHKLLLVSAMLFSISCTSTSEDQASTEDGLGPVDEDAPAEISDADVEKALADVGGPMDEEAAVSEEAPVAAEEEAPAQELAPSEALQADDVESYKLDDATASQDPVTPASSDSTSLEDESSLTREPSVDLAKDDSSSLGAAPSSLEEPAAMEPAREATPMSMSGDSMLYSIRRGESISIVARKLMGGVKKWRELARFNGIKNANRVHAGQMIKIPLNDDNRSLVDNFVSKHSKSVTVKRGDTLAKIASRTLGSVKAWKYLWKNNEGVISNPNRIEVGTVLNYVSEGRAVGVAKRGSKKKVATSESH